MIVGSDEDKKFTVLLDENVAVSVADVFQNAGHTVIHHKDVLAESAPDTLVARIAIENGAILAAHDKDFNRIVNEDRFKRLNVILFECKNHLAGTRADQFMSLIEHEWFASCRKQAGRLHLRIRAHSVTTHR